MMRLTMEPSFPPEDWEWLKREAAKRNVEIKDVINGLMQVHMPNGFRTDWPMSEEEFSKHFEDLMLAMVRKARLQIQ